MAGLLALLIWLPLSAGALLAQTSPGAIQAIGSVTIGVQLIQ